MAFIHPEFRISPKELEDLSVLEVYKPNPIARKRQAQNQNFKETVGYTVDKVSENALSDGGFELVEAKFLRVKIPSSGTAIDVDAAGFNSQRVVRIGASEGGDYCEADIGIPDFTNYGAGVLVENYLIDGQDTLDSIDGDSYFFVLVKGIVLARSGGAFSAGDDLSVNASGKLVKATSGRTVATAIKNSASGDALVRVYFRGIDISAFDNVVDANALHVNVAGEINGITEKVTPVDADELIIEDSADSYNKKKLKFSAVRNANDPDAIHNNVAGEIAAVAAKVTPVGADVVLIEDSADSNNKKKLELTSLLSTAPSGPAGGELSGTYPNPTVNDGADATAIHDNESGEITALVEKVAPVAADVLLIEDSADSNNKKKVLYSTITSANDPDAIHDNVAGETLSIPLADSTGPRQYDRFIMEDSNDSWNKKTMRLNEFGLGLPEELSDATKNAGSVGSTFARKDHVHPHGDRGRMYSGSVPLHQEFLGSTAVADGQPGFVTKPLIADRGNYLTGDGTYKVAIDNDAIHDDVAGEIAAVAEKVTPIGADVLLIEDSADTNSKKKVQIANLPATTPAVHNLGGVEHAADTLANLNTKVSDATLDDSGDSRPPNGAAGGDLGGTYPNPSVNDGADGTAIHDNVAAEISAVTEKTAPVPADLVLIEDSEDSNNKKRVTLTNLHGGMVAPVSLSKSYANMVDSIGDPNLDPWGIVGSLLSQLSAVTVDGTPTTQDVDDLNRLHIAVNITTITSAGTLRFTGTSYNKATGATTPADTEDIAIAAGETGWYKTSKYWIGTVTLSSVGGLDIVLDADIFGSYHPTDDMERDIRSITADFLSGTVSNQLDLEVWHYDFAARTRTSVYSPSDTNVTSNVPSTMRKTFTAGTNTIDFAGGDRLVVTADTDSIDFLNFTMEMY